MPAPRKRRTTTEVNLAGDRWRRRPVNTNGSINASSAEAPPCAEVIRSKMVIRFFDWSTYVRALRTLEKDIDMEFYAEDVFQEGDDEKQPV